MRFRTGLLAGLIALACALGLAAPASATSTARVEWVLTTPIYIGNLRGTADGAAWYVAGPGQKLTVTGSTPVQSNAAPPFGNGASGGGYARVTPLSGAVVCTFDGSSPSDAAGSTNGIRFAVGDPNIKPVRIDTGVSLSCIEALDQPASSSSLTNYALETGGNLTGIKSDADTIAGWSAPLTNAQLTAQALATAANQATMIADLGAPGSTVCATDTGSCALNAQIQRLLQRTSTLISNLGTPQQDTAYRTVTAPLGTPSNEVDGNVTSLSTTTETTLIAAQGAGLRIELDYVAIYNPDSQDHVYAIRTVAAGSVRAWATIPAGTASPVFLPSSGLNAAAANTAVTVQIVDSNTITTASQVSAHGFRTPS